MPPFPLLLKLLTTLSSYSGHIQGTLPARAPGNSGTRATGAASHGLSPAGVRPSPSELSASLWAQAAGATGTVLCRRPRLSPQAHQQPCSPGTSPPCTGQRRPPARSNPGKRALALGLEEGTGGEGAKQCPLDLPPYIPELSGKTVDGALADATTSSEQETLCPTSKYPTLRTTPRGCCTKFPSLDPVIRVLD